MKTENNEDMQRYTELIARHDAFFFIELPMRQAMIQMEIAAMQQIAEIRHCEARRKMAEENAGFYRKLAKTNKLNSCSPSSPS